MNRQTLTFACAALLAAGGAAAYAAQPQHGDHKDHQAKAEHKHHPDVGAHQSWHHALHEAVGAPSRTAANVARDQYRHPFETLAFLGVQPNQTVVEIWPGGGWYTEILAPYLRRGGGTYYGAAPTAQQFTRMNEWRTAQPDLYGGIRTAIFPVVDDAATGVPDGTADVVLTFRNVHNFIMGSGRNNQDYSVEAFRQMFAMLKPGGTLGIVDHRLPDSADAARERSSGYVRVATVRRLAEAAGFEFVRSSEINANPRDTADWPNGVWTLPPALRHGEEERYRAIGESDRMTLMFRRPR